MPLSRLNLNRRGPWVLGSGAGSPDSCTLRLSSAASDVYKRQTLLSPFRMCDIALSSAIPERKSLLTVPRSFPRWERSNVLRSLSSKPRLWYRMKLSETSWNSPTSAEASISTCPTPRVDGRFWNMNSRCRRSSRICLLYTSDAADDLLCVDLG